MFTKNQTLKTDGIDMSCNPTIETVTFIEYLEKPKNLTDYEGNPYIQDCVIMDQGLKIITNSSGLWV